MKRDYFSELDIKARDEKESAKLQGELDALQEGREKMDLESRGSDSKIYVAYQELEKAQVCRNMDEIDSLSDEFNHLLRDKLAFRDAYFKRRDAIHVKLGLIVTPYRAEAVRLLDDQIGKIDELYVFEAPRTRKTVQGENIDDPWHVEYKDVGKKEVSFRYRMVSTNASAVEKYKLTLVGAKVKAIRAASLNELRVLLQTLEKDLLEISLEPREAKINEADYEKSNLENYRDVAMVTSGAVLKMKGELSKAIGSDRR